MRSLSDLTAFLATRLDLPCRAVQQTARHLRKEGLLARGAGGRGGVGAAAATPEAAARLLIALMGAPTASRAGDAVRIIGRLPTQYAWDGRPGPGGLVLNGAFASDVPIPQGGGPAWAYLGEHFENLLAYLIAHANEAAAGQLPVQEIIITRDLTAPATLVLLANPQSEEVSALICAKDATDYRLSSKPLVIKATIAGGVLADLRAWLGTEPSSISDRPMPSRVAVPESHAAAGGR